MNPQYSPTLRTSAYQLLVKTLPALALFILAGCSDDLPQLVSTPANPPAAIWIENVDVFDSVDGRIEPSQDVLIRAGRIDTVSPSGERPAPNGAEVIDGSNATLLPGLIDAHGHISSTPWPPWDLVIPDEEANLRAFLYCGVTTLFDPGEPDAKAAVERRDRVASGELLGPRIYTAGKYLTARGGHPVALAEQVLPWWLAWFILPRIAHEVGTEEQARQAAVEVDRSGADMLKIIVDAAPDEDTPRLTAKIVAAATDQARKLGLRTVAHIGNFDDAVDTGRAGIAAWVHGVYKEPLNDVQVTELAAFRIPMAPTLTVFDSYATAFDGNRISTKLERETAPPHVLDAIANVSPDHPSAEPFREYMAMLKANRRAGAENARKLHEAGVTILAGSDPQTAVFSGAGLHREIIALAEAGLPKSEALKAATINVARFLTEEHDPEFGIVAAGKRADLLLVEGNPLDDIAQISEIREVIVSGVRLVREPAR
jgi:imidazolonepropionase-like amidohydrolase